MLAQRSDEGMTTGPGADFGEDHQVGALLAGDPFGLAAGTAGRCVLGVKGEQTQHVRGRLVRGRLAGLAGAGG